MDLARLSPEDRVTALYLWEERERLAAEENFRDFVRLAWPIVEPGKPFVPNWHIDAVADHLHACATGEIRNLIINIPPRCLKSTIACVMWTPWVWLKRPDLRFLYGSYAQTLSMRDSVSARRLIESDWYRRRFSVKWRLTDDQNTKARFENNRTGVRHATSVGGAVIGMGGDFLVLDDPQKPEDVYSDTVRASTLSWCDESFWTRGNDPKTVVKVVIMQRLHEEDVTGHALEKGGWDHLCLPMEYEVPKQPKPTSIGWVDPRKEPGELLIPDRQGREEVDDLKRTLGELAAAGQLQQHPSALDGDIIKREWIQFYDIRPEKLDEIAIFADLTFKEGVTNDFTVVEAWGRRGTDIFLLAQIRNRMGFPDQLIAIKSMKAMFPEAIAIVVEEAANGAAVLATLKNDLMGLVPYKPLTAKAARLAAVSPVYQAKNVHYPNPKTHPWIEINLAEILSFPNAKHDDTVDVASMAVFRLSQTSSTIARIEAMSRW